MFVFKSLSLFMSWVGKTYCNSSPPTDQSTFFTNFRNRISSEENKFLEILNFELYLHEKITVEVEKTP